MHAIAAVSCVQSEYLSLQVPLLLPILLPLVELWFNCFLGILVVSGPKIFQIIWFISLMC